MNTTASFDELLNAVQRLTPEEQADLVHVIQRRLAEQGRQRVAQDVRDARAEHAAGRTAATSVTDLMREIQS